MTTRYGRLSVTLAERAPRLARSLTRAMRRAGLRDPSVIPRRFKPLLTAPADREILRTAGTDFAARALLEATRQGPYETVREQRTMLQPPGFRLEDVTLAVTLWHGEQDSLIPISHSKDSRDVYPPRRSSLSQTSGTFTNQRPSSRSPLRWCASPRSRRQLTALRLTELSLAGWPDLGANWPDPAPTTRLVIDPLDASLQAQRPVVVDISASEKLPFAATKS
jgi:hypothetical protein